MVIECNYFCEVCVFSCECLLFSVFLTCLPRSLIDTAPTHFTLPWCWSFTDDICYILDRRTGAEIIFSRTSLMCCASGCVKCLSLEQSVSGCLLVHFWMEPNSGVK